jgi:probable HAF family extracellular repeat protein
MMKRVNLVRMAPAEGSVGVGAWEESTMSTRVVVAILACLLLTFLVVGCPPKQPQYSMRYSVVALDTRSGSANDINGSCEVVGYLKFSDHNSAFLWSPDAPVKMQDLGGDTRVAYGINDYAEVTGSKTHEYFWHAFRWTAATGVQDVAPWWDNFSIGYDISNMGTIAGYSEDLSGHYRAYTWRPDAGYEFIAQAEQGSRAYGINNLDTTAGVLIAGPDANLTIEVRSWTPDGIDRGLQNVLGHGASLANAINDLNKAVGTFEDYRDWWVACSWTASGGMKNLGGLGHYTKRDRILFSSEATDINWHGDIVGNAISSSGIQHAVLWEDDVCYDLNYLAPIASSPDWVFLEEANAINNKGCIVGRGYLRVTGDDVEGVPCMLVPVIPEELILSPSTAPGGATINCTVLFSGELPVEMRISLDLSGVSSLVGPAVGVVDVPKGEDRGHFVLHTNDILRTRTGDVAVEVGGYRLTAPLTVQGVEIPIR